MKIAKTILQQLGGRRFATMTGSREFTALPSGLKFKIGGGAKNGINHCEVMLEPSDTYRMSFWRVRAGKGTLIEEVSGVYCDQLQNVFTSKTGMATRL